MSTITRTCPTCGHPAEGPNDHHLVFASFMNPHLLEGDARRPVRCLDCSQAAPPCGYLPPEPSQDD
jgi:hypothetical protein